MSGSRRRPGYRRPLTPEQRALRDSLIAGLHRYGVSVSAIGRTLDLSRKVVHYVLDKPRRAA